MMRDFLKASSSCNIAVTFKIIYFQNVQVSGKADIYCPLPTAFEKLVGNLLLEWPFAHVVKSTSEKFQHFNQGKMKEYQ